MLVAAAPVCPLLVVALRSASGVVHMVFCQLMRDAAAPFNAVCTLYACMHACTHVLPAWTC